MSNVLKRAGTILLAVMMAVTFIPVSLMAQTDVAKAAATYPSDPRVTDDETTWDCVYFGHYLQGPYI